jgi:hypothetical protein
MLRSMPLDGDEALGGSLTGTNPPPRLESGFCRAFGSFVMRTPTWTPSIVPGGARRFDLQLADVPSDIVDFVERHEGHHRQLALRCLSRHPDRYYTLRTCGNECLNRLAFAAAGRGEGPSAASAG